VSADLVEQHCVVSVASRQQPTTRSGGRRFLASVGSPRFSRSANIASAYRVSMAFGRQAAPGMMTG